MCRPNVHEGHLVARENVVQHYSRSVSLNQGETEDSSPKANGRLASRQGVPLREAFSEGVQKISPFFYLASAYRRGARAIWAHVARACPRPPALRKPVCEAIRTNVLYRTYHMAARRAKGNI